MTASGAASTHDQSEICRACQSSGLPWCPIRSRRIPFSVVSCVRNRYKGTMNHARMLAVLIPFIVVGAASARDPAISPVEEDWRDNATVKKWPPAHQ
jgi:hypothetical protein